MLINELPEMLTAQHISNYLGISRGKVYMLFQINPAAGGIPNFAIGTSKRVEKKDFVTWIETRKLEKTQRLTS